MTFEEVIAEFGAQVATGTLPTGGDVKSCLIRTFMRLLDEYAQTDSALAQEIDALITAVGNQSDPLLKGVPMSTRMAAWAALNSIQKGRQYAKAKINP